MEQLFDALDSTFDELVWGEPRNIYEPELEVLIDSAELQGIFDPIDDTQFPFVEIYEDTRHIGNTEGYDPMFNDTASPLLVSIKPVWNQSFRFRANGSRYYRFVVCIDHNVRARTVCGECGFAAADAWAAVGKAEGPLAVSMMIQRRNEVTGVLRIICSLRLPGDDPSRDAQVFEWKKTDLLSLGKRSAVYACRPEHLPPSKAKLAAPPPWEYSKPTFLEQGYPPPTPQSYMPPQAYPSTDGRLSSRSFLPPQSSSRFQNSSLLRNYEPEFVSHVVPKEALPRSADWNSHKYASPAPAMQAAPAPTPPTSQKFAEVPAAYAAAPSQPYIPSNVEDFGAYRSLAASETIARQVHGVKAVAVPDVPLPGIAASPPSSCQGSQPALSRQGSQLAMRSEGRISVAPGEATNPRYARPEAPPSFAVEPIAVEQAPTLAEHASQLPLAQVFHLEAQTRAVTPVMWSSAPSVVAFARQRSGDLPTSAAAAAEPAQRQWSGADVPGRQATPESPAIVTLQASLAEMALQSPDGDQYMADNSLLKADTLGLGYRASPNLEDTMPDQRCVYWSMPVFGIDEGNGWLRVHQVGEVGGEAPDLFLPMKLSGLPVLRPPRKDEAANWPRHDTRRLQSGRSQQSYVLQPPQLNAPSRPGTPRGL